MDFKIKAPRLKGRIRSRARKIKNQKRILGRDARKQALLIIEEMFGFGIDWEK